MRIKTAGRLLTLMLALLLMFTLFPAAAFAAEETVSVDINVEKKLIGDKPPSNETFTFKLTPKDNAPMPADGDTVTISGAGTASFGGVSFGEPIDYIYTIEEVKGSAANYKYDTVKYTLTVQVTTDDTGKLYAACYYQPDNDGAKSRTGATFTNSYTAPPTGGGGGGGSPKTGDNTYNALWLALLAISAVGMAVSSAPGRKKRKN